MSSPDTPTPDDPYTPESGSTAAGAAMRLRSDPYLDAATSMTTRAMLLRIPRTLRRAVGLCWAVDRAGVAMLLALQVTGAVLAAATLTATTMSLRALLASGTVGGRVVDAAPALVALVVAAAVYRLTDAAATAVGHRLAPKVVREADLRVLDAAVNAELAAYESPGFEDALEAAGGGAEKVADLVLDTQRLVSTCAQLVAAAAVAAVLHPLLLPLLVLAVLPRAWASARAARIQHAAAHRMLSDTRLRSVLRSYTVDRPHAAEIRAGTMGEFLLGQYRQVSARLERETLTAERHALRTRLYGDAISGIALAGAWAALALLAATGRVNLAAAGTAVLAVRTAATALSGIVTAGAALFRTSLRLDDWTRFLHLAEHLRLNRGTHQPTTATWPATIRTTALTYTYPGTTRPVLHGIDLELHRGQVIALVGENGSGKTTLAKVLTGLLLPTGGTVHWDEHDLADVDPATLWRQVGVVPQDYTRWPMPARENISLGQPHPDGDHAVHTAAHAAGADTVIATLPTGLDTLLARSWWGGHELSGGQWQRIAIARAFHRNAPVLILDEPTAALDARAEHNVFTRLRTLAQGRITSSSPTASPTPASPTTSSSWTTAPSPNTAPSTNSSTTLAYLPSYTNSSKTRRFMVGPTLSR